MPLDQDIQAEFKRAIEGVGPNATPLRSLIRREASTLDEHRADMATQAELDAAIAAAKAALFPVGAIYTSVVSTNPGTLLGFGTWTAFGAGRVLVGLDSGDADWDTVEETRGAKTHTLVGGEIPAVTVSAPYTTAGGGTTTGTGIPPHNATPSGGTWSVSSSNAGGAHNNLQPSIVVYFWKRTA